ncbi:hypothetical protein FAGAP_11591 [Fusarium agapanthi]|uniref:Ankyrin repeat protein n=1 Tax=Fusarium agapanthi TaxID=1803897 RepID=A0A9P5E3H3_9HYPO|nr:hypothetical protein FAGAP_11591 [Fusarium agapanthi]
MTSSNPRSFNFPTRSSVYSPYPVETVYPFDPLTALLSPQHRPQHRPKEPPQAMLSPTCLAAVRNVPEVIRFMHRFYQKDMAREYDLALFLANRQGHQGTASLLLDLHANPGRENAANGLHGAAWRGLGGNIKVYINTYGAKPDVTDGSSATPIIYAILGIQLEPRAWQTIKCLMSYGARQWTRFGSKELSYAEIALMAGKEYLAQKFKELESSPSPTILNSSREPSHEPGEGNDQPNDKQPQEGSEADGGVSLSRERSCTVGRDDVDNEELRDDPEADGGASLSRERSCTVGRDDDIQPKNKRPREDSEASGGAKRAREV